MESPASYHVPAHCQLRINRCTLRVPHMNESVDPRRINRRALSRSTCHLSVRYRGAGDWRPATAMDVSRQGCRLRTGEDVARGSVLEVAFSRAIGGDLPPVVVSGRVIWCRVEGLSRQVGLHFDDAPAALDELIASLC
jgi:hypothetical protein